MSLALAIAGNSINFVPSSFQFVQDSILSWSLSFTVEDAPGTNHYANRMPVTATDSVKGLIFAGFIDQPDETNLYPNAQNEVAIRCVDYRELASKRRPTYEYSNMQAGDIVIDMLSNYLAAEGVTANYAYRSDQTQAGFAAGTLTGVTATNNLPPGDSELTPAGTTVANNDNMTAFNAATQASDTFVRANQAGFGTASDGETWIFSGATATESIAGNEGVISATAGSDTFAQLGVNTATDCLVQCRIAINNTGDIAGVQARFNSSSGGTAYKLLYYSGAIHINKAINGTNTVDLTPSVVLTMTPGTFYQFKLATVGNGIYGKVWQDGTTEPVNWMLTTVDATIAGGSYALLANTGTGSGVQFDHFTASAISGNTSVDIHTNQVNLHAYNVVKMTGTCAISGLNAFVYWKIWTGSHLIASGDTLQYDVWVSSTSPLTMAGVDFICTDGTSMRDFNGQGIVDQYGIAAHPGSDLSGFANDQWYTRSIDISAMAGKTMSFLDISFEGDNVGAYQAYFRNIKLTNGGITQVTFYDSTTHPYDPQNASPVANTQVSNNGYSNVTVGSVTAYDQTGSRISPAINIDPVKVVGSSEVSWYSVVPTGVMPASRTSGSNAPAVPVGTSVSLLTSIDNQITFQPATYAGPIADLETGFNVAGRSLYTQIALAITGTTPEVSPAVSALTTMVTTAFISGTTNALASYATNANFNTGVNSNTQNWSYVTNDMSTNVPVGSVTLTGMFYNFFAPNGANGNANVQVFGTASPAKANLKRQLKLTTGTGTDVKGELTYYGPTVSYQNFTAQVLVQIPSGNTNIGLVYRTTGWVNGNDTYAYVADLSTSLVTLGRGTNGGASTFTSIATAAVTLTAGNWYTLKIVINGNSHQVYVDEVLYINATDATYPAAGQIGLRLFNNTGSTQSGFFQNFGVVNALTGTWTSPATSLNALGTIGNSAVFWNSIVPNGGALTCASSLDGGTTWQPVAQGGQIGNAPPGTNVSGKSVQLQFTFTSPNASVTPVLQSVSIWAVSQVTASGTRISPVLNLFNGRAGGNSLTWNANLPTGCTVGMDISPDGTTWTDVSSANGQPLPSSIMKTQPDPWLDFFASITDWTDQDIGAVGVAGSASYASPTWTIKGSGADINGTADAFHYDYQVVSGTIVLTARVVTQQNTASTAKAGLMVRQDTTASSVFFMVYATPAGKINFAYRSTSGGVVTFGTAITQAIPEYLKISNSGTSWSAYTSPDGVTWTLIPGSVTTLANLTGTMLAGLIVCSVSNSVLNTSTFDTVTISGTLARTDYNSTFLSGGTTGTWTWDTTNHQLIGNQASGIDGIVQYSGFTTFADMFVEADLNYSDSGGLVARMVDVNNAYFLSIHDASSASNPNTLILQKIVAGVVSTIAGPTAISFTRGDYHRFRLDCQGTTIKSFMDSVQIQSVTDTGVTAAGSAGLLAGQTTGNQIQFLSLRIQPYGDNVNGKALYTRQRLASTNPVVTPQVTNVTLSVRDPEIGTGALISSTKYAYKNTVATSYDDLAKQSTGPNPFLWYIDPNLGLHFKQNRATPAPFYIFAGPNPATSTMLANPVPKVSSPDMNYCNRITVDGGTDQSSVPAITRTGDGITQIWTMPGSLAQAPVITRNGQVALIGVKGVDTGKDFYWQLGSNVISQDPSETPPGVTDTIVFGNLFIQVPVRVTLNNVNGSGIYAGTVGQIQLAAIDHTSGIVEDYLSVPGLSTAAATALAQSQLIQRGRLGQNITFSTKKWGLQAGMLALITEPQQGVINQPFVITKVTIRLQPAVGSTDPDVIGGILYITQVEATSGPIIGSWTSLFSEMLGAVAGNIR